MQILSLHGDLSQLDADAKLEFSLGHHALLRQIVVSNKWLIFTQALAFSVLLSALNDLRPSIVIYVVCLAGQSFLINAAASVLKDVAFLMTESRFRGGISVADQVVIFALVLSISCIGRFLFNMIWYLVKPVKCCTGRIQNKGIHVTIALTIGVLAIGAIVADLTVVYVMLTFMALFKVSTSDNNDEPQNRILTMQLILAFQFLICHTGALFNDWWRITDRDNLPVNYRLARWMEGDISGWFDS